MLSSGSRDNTIKHWDVRLRNPLITQSSVHTQEVCGLKVSPLIAVNFCLTNFLLLPTAQWSPCGEHLASGANDNLLCVWKKDQLEEPLHKFTKHCAAVKVTPVLRSGSNSRIDEVFCLLPMPFHRPSTGVPTKLAFWRAEGERPIVTFASGTSVPDGASASRIRAHRYFFS